MKKSKSQSAIEFCDKFDEVLKVLDVCNPEASTSEDEIKSIFYHAVKNTSPVLVSTRMVRNQTGTDMSYDEMKNCILQTDAERVNINFQMTPEATASANAAARGKRLEIQRRRENICNRCNRAGHWMADCPWKGTDKWFCYKCNGDKNHNPKQYSQFDLDAVQLDVKTAFLNGVLQDDIYMEIPEGVNCNDETRNTKVCKLKRTLYGLKISPKSRNERFTEEVNKLGLERDINDPCLFTWRKNNTMALLVLYVDDIILAINNPEKLQEIKVKLCKAFHMKDLGEPRMYLGMKIERDRKNKILTLKQSEYTEKISERFKMKECNAQEIPMVTRQVKNRERRASGKTNTTKTSSFPYREAICSLLYLAGATRPDISFAVNHLSRKQASPTEEDWKDVKRIFRYLRGTTGKGLIFRAKTEKLEACTDASFRDCKESHFISGYIIKLFGDTVAWRSHKQQHVGVSTCQAEYLSMTEVCQELISLDKALKDSTGHTFYPATIWCDNKSARDCTQMDGTNKLKAFDDDYEEIQRKLKVREITGNKERITQAHGDCIKSCVMQKRVEIQWVQSKENIADIMIKPLPKPSHLYLREKILG